MKKPSGHSKFTLEERKRIVKEYVESALSASDLCKKYGIGATSTLYTWRSQLQESEKNCIFAAKNKRQSDNAPQTNDGYSIFEMKVAPTFDFIQELRSLGAEVKVLAPQCLANWLRLDAENVVKLYK